MYQRVNCFDKNGNSINGFTQWDINQTLYINNWNYDSTPIFHFCNTKSSEALVVKGLIEENYRAKANIPNILLQESYPINVFVYLEDGESGNTIYVSQIPVKKKKKPNDYEYTENVEYVSWIKLEAEAMDYLAELEKETNRFKQEYEETLGTAKNNADIAVQAAETANECKNKAYNSELAAKNSELAAKNSESNAKESERKAREIVDSIITDVFIGYPETDFADYSAAFAQEKVVFLINNSDRSNLRYLATRFDNNKGEFYCVDDNGTIHYATKYSSEECIFGTVEVGSSGIPEIFVGDENTTVAEYYAAFTSGKACFMIRPYGGTGNTMWTAYTCNQSNAQFYRITGSGAIQYGMLNSDGTFNYTTLGRTTTIDEKSTDDQIPTAKAVYEFGKNSIPDSIGLTATEKSLILTLFRNAAYTSPDMNGVLAQLESLWSGSGGGETGKTLTSISATYSGGDVAVGTAVTDLTGIVVTAHYSDGTSEAVTGYILSGTIAEGSNTITVSYGGKTTTFTVIGTAESGGNDAVNLYSGELLKTNNINDVVQNGNVISYTVGANGSTATFTIEGLEANKDYTIFVDTDRAETTSGKYCVCYVTTEEHAIYSGKIAELRPANYGGKDYATFTANGNTLYLWFNEVGSAVTGLTPTYTVHIYEGTLTERP